ncbi:DsbA family protein [Cupriavidus sp. D39]|uniref:DsbA family protein n=1 Tax=Cupriavidus sp. D39 TaxID=2997877 RepID=UPI00226DFACF|nr:DsbA family protein [Cupriavidus sp. D39]MCY0852591.1 DsbA family protein [Cupriavidus sp. D39]
MLWRGTDDQCGAKIPELKIQAHGVGMLSGPKAQMMSAEWRDFVRPHESRIHAFSKQEFGDAYVHGVQEHQDVLLDSSPPIAAMLVADKLDGRGIQMLKRLQNAYFMEGQAIADPAVIGKLARELGYNSEAFLGELTAELQNAVDGHITASNDMLHTLKAKGFPAFALEMGGELHSLPMGRYFTRPALFKTDIEGLLKST